MANAILVLGLPKLVILLILPQAKCLKFVKRLLSFRLPVVPTMLRPTN